MAGGRPSKYTPELLERAHWYLENWQETIDKAPSIAGLACELKIGRETVREWAMAEGKEEFSGIVRDILSTQERVLTGSGLDGTFNPSITKLMLTKHGYSDQRDVKQETAFSVTIGDKDGGTL